MTRVKAGKGAAFQGLGRLAKVQHFEEVDAEKLQRDLQQLLRWSASKSLPDNATGSRVSYMDENNLSESLMDG